MSLEYFLVKTIPVRESLLHWRCMQLDNTLLYHRDAARQSLPVAGMNETDKRIENLMNKGMVLV